MDSYRPGIFGLDGPSGFASQVTVIASRGHPAPCSHRLEVRAASSQVELAASERQAYGTWVINLLLSGLRLEAANACGAVAQGVQGVGKGLMVKRQLGKVSVRGSVRSRCGAIAASSLVNFRSGRAIAVGSPVGVSCRSSRDNCRYGESGEVVSINELGPQVVPPSLADCPTYIPRRRFGWR